MLATRRHIGPLVVQKPLYPEGGDICHVVVVHAPGGIAGGDQLSLEAEVEAGAHALLTTPAATKWYKANGARSGQQIRFQVGDGAALEWLPQENILFDQADSELATEIELSGQARFAGWEITCLGRRAAGERFQAGRLRQALKVSRGGRRLWGDFAVLEGGDLLLDSPVGLDGRSVFGAMVVAGGGPVPTDLLEALRGVTAPPGLAVGVSALPEIFSARALGDSAQAARAYFEALWSLLRPWYAGRPAQRLRLWDT